MHICHVISVPFPPEEGIGNYVHNLSTKLIEKGHKVTVITRGNIGATQRESIDGINVIRAPFIPIYPFYIHFHGLFVKKIIKSMETQITILHFHSPLPPPIKTSIPMITTIHSPMLTDSRYTKIQSIYSLFSKISARYVSYPLELKIIQSSDIITTVSKSIAQELKEYDINLDEITVINNGVNETFFYPLKKETNEENKYIMYVGRIDYEKGLFDLIKCGKYISNKRSDLSFIIAGIGKDFKKLKNKIKKENLQDMFKFLGQVDKDKLLKLYQNATLFVFPSYHEGLPGVLLEAMSCGLPIIATDVRGNRDLISHKENGLLIPIQDSKKMAETISILLENKKLREQLGKNARKTIVEKYTWNNVYNHYLKCYEKLTRG
jgi:glycosyltransferase involved in cell wall biosynthesis